MILPEKMTRILVVGSKNSLPQTIDILYGLETVHLVDFSAEEPGFALGSPLSTASDASQKLLKLRSMERDLDIKEVKGMKIEVIPIEKINSEVDETIRTLEAEIVGVVETKGNSQARMHEIEQKKKQLEPFMTVPLPLELYSGYDSLTVFTGYVKMDPTAALTQAVKQFEIYKSTDGNFVAVFTPKSEAAEAQKVLIQNGYSDMPAPTGKGEPAAEVKRLDEEYAVETKTLEDATKKIDRSPGKAPILHPGLGRATKHRGGEGGDADPGGNHRPRICDGRMGPFRRHQRHREGVGREIGLQRPAGGHQRSAPGREA